MNKDLWIGVGVVIVVWLFWRWRRGSNALFMQGGANNLWPGSSVYWVNNAPAPRKRKRHGNGYGWGRVQKFPNTQGPYRVG
jgi:hypothetical protein